MSRVHDALRRAEQGGVLAGESPAVGAESFRPEAPPAMQPAPVKPPSLRLNLSPSLLDQVPLVPFQPAPESHLLDLSNSHETPAEEFRTLRTRLNHLQTLQPLHTVVVTSPSPAEGKTFSAVNLALAQSHLAESSVLLGDFDLRRPVIHNLFQIDRAPGLSDYLTGQCTFPQYSMQNQALIAPQNPVEVTFGLPFLEESGNPFFKHHHLVLDASGRGFFL